MGSLGSAIEQVATILGAIWLVCLLLFAFGYPLYGMLSGAKPSDPPPKWVDHCMFVAIAPKVLIGGGVYVIFVWIPLGVIRLLQQQKNSLGYRK